MLMTDHRPLVPILNAYTLDAVENPRLQRVKEKISPYLFTAVWRAGKLLCIPDALSRAPVSRPTPEDEMACTDATAHLRRVVAANAERPDRDAPHHDDDRTLQEFRAAASADPSYARLTACVTSGFPSNQYELLSPLLPYWKLRDHLYADEVLVLYGQRIVVPAALLAPSHVSTTAIGVWKPLAAGRGRLFSGLALTLTSQVLFVPASHVKCYSRANNRNPRYVTTTPPGPLSLSPQRTIQMFCRYFREVGVPLRLRTDGGPQFASAAFKNFMERWGVHHVVTSPHYPRGGCQVSEAPHNEDSPFRQH